jgi:hypothetical protein
MDWSAGSNCELPRNDHEKTLGRLHVEPVKLPRQVVRKRLSRVCGAARYSSTRASSRPACTAFTSAAWSRSV